MKTVVLGLFDDPAAAEQVLRQLAQSPLDMRSVHVVHADATVQRNLERAVLLPCRRGAVGGALTGAVVGAALALFAQATMAPLAALGPLLAASGGIVLGGLGGAALAVSATAVAIPPASAAEVARAVEDGATAVVVQTDKLPTARAIADLFRLAGSRLPTAADSLSPPPASADGAATPSPVAWQEDHSQFAPRRPRAAGSPPVGSGDPATGADLSA